MKIESAIPDLKDSGGIQAWDPLKDLADFRWVGEWERSRRTIGDVDRWRRAHGGEVTYKRGLEDSGPFSGIFSKFLCNSFGCGHDSLLDELFDFNGREGGTLALKWSPVGVTWLSVGDQLNVDVCLLLDRLQRGQRDRGG